MKKQLDKILKRLANAIQKEFRQTQLFDQNYVITLGVGRYTIHFNRNYEPNNEIAEIPPVIIKLINACLLQIQELWEEKGGGHYYFNDFINNDFTIFIDIEEEVLNDHVINDLKEHLIELKLNLEEAIAVEEYEKAAIIRDKIIICKNKLNTVIQTQNV